MGRVHSHVLRDLMEQKNAAEATFRYEVTRVRENAEDIALIGGDKAAEWPLRSAGRCAWQ